MTYQDLDLNARINLKGLLAEWARIAPQHFQDSLDKKLYRVGTKKRGGPASGAKRTGNLRNHWWHNVAGGADSPRVVLEFLQYGRYVDMGVGRGVGITDRLVNRRLRLGSTGRHSVGRTPRRWYARKKGYELHRLRELLATRYLDVPLAFLENSLNLSSLTIPL